ncbi:MAG: hypothetical protein QNJ45_26305 [Ardenticatenaceae bacterium]|nr:hypothetical protein [Ardenticatenaceae bacterium]
MRFYKRSAPALLIAVLFLLTAAACQQATMDLDPVPTFPAASSETVADDQSTSADPPVTPAAPAEEGSPDQPAEAESASEPEIEGEESPARATGRIAYINLDGQLATVNPDGSDTRLLTGEGEFYQFPAWSPAGDQIAVIGFSEGGSGVFVFDDVAEAEATTIYEDDEKAPIYLYWFPDGSQVSFIAPSAETADLSLYLVPADGSSVGSVLTTGQPLYWQWMGNNRQAMVHVDNDRLSFLDVEGNESSTGLGRNGAFQAPAISWTNRYFAYQQVGSDGRMLEIKDVVEDEVIFESPHDGILTMSWSPELLKLAYVDPPERAGFVGPLVLFDVDTREAQTIVPHNVLTFFWSPDGRYIAFLTPDELSRQTNTPNNNLNRIRSASQERPTLALGVVDVENGIVNYISDFVPTGLFIRQFIPFFDQYALSHRIWSPDSQFIVLPVVSEEDDRPVIRVFGVEGQTPVTIGDGVSAFWSHQ